MQALDARPTRVSGRWRARVALAAVPASAALALLLAGCPEGSRQETARNTAAPLQSLTVAEVDLLLARAVSEAQAAGRPAAVAVVDREGEVLGAFVMASADVNGDGTTDALSASNLGTAISKAATAALFQSEQDAFTSRTAYFIVQGHFPPGIANTPAGPLFGVQDSSLPSSDVRSAAYDQTGRAVGRGVSGELGGVPLFKNGAPVGAIGIDTVDVFTMQGGSPTLVTPVQNDLDEAIAEAAARSLAAPAPIRATEIALDGIVLPFVEATRLPRAPLLASTAAGLQTQSLGAVPAQLPVRVSPLPPEDRIAGQFGIRGSRRYQGRLVARLGGAFTSADRAGGVSFDPASYAVQSVPMTALGSQALGGVPGEVRFPAIDSVEPPPAEGGLTQADVVELLRRGSRAASGASAAIRLPRGETARVHIAVVDLRGNILGIFRMGDGTLFSQDVAVQKARTSAFFSTDDFAASARGIGFLSQPFFPPSVQQTPPGPLVRLRDLVNRGLIPIESPPSNLLVFPPPRPPSDGTTDEDPLAPGLQAFDDFPGAAPAAALAATRARIAASGGAPPLVDRPDTAPPFVSPGLQSGMQTFAGGVPLYKNGRLVGGVGASGDGIDEDDLTVFAASQAPFAPPAGARIDECPDAKIVARVNARVAALAAAVAAHPDPAVGQVYGPIFARERDAIAAAMAGGLSGVRIPYVKLPRNPGER